MHRGEGAGQGEGANQLAVFCSPVELNISWIICFSRIFNMLAGCLRGKYRGITSFSAVFKQASVLHVRKQVKLC